MFFLIPHPIFFQHEVFEDLGDRIDSVVFPDGQDVHILMIALERNKRQIRGVTEDAHNGLGKDGDAYAGGDEDHQGLRVGGAGVDPGDEARLRVFVRNDMTVFFGRGVVVIFSQKERLVPQVIAADRGELGVGVSGRKYRVEPVSANTLIREVGEIRVAVYNVEE